MRGMGVRAVSPHLDPLLQGERTARNAQWRAEQSGLFCAWRMGHFIQIFATSPQVFVFSE